MTALSTQIHPDYTRAVFPVQGHTIAFNFSINVICGNNSVAAVGTLPDKFLGLFLSLLAADFRPCQTLWFCNSK